MHIRNQAHIKNAAKLLILFSLCLLFILPTYAKTTRKNAVHIGVFNNAQQARSFYEGLPHDITASIRKDQLWLDVYKTQRGFLEHQINVDNISSSQAKILCDIVKTKNAQCLITGLQPLFPSAQKLPANKQIIAKPKILEPLGLNLNNEIAALDLSLIEEDRPESNIRKTTRQKLEAYGKDFKLEPQKSNTKTNRTEYAIARDKLLSAIQNIGAGINTGTASDAVRQELQTLGRSAFEAAGKAYLSGFINKYDTPNKILSPTSNAGKTFVKHISLNLNESVNKTIEDVLSQTLTSLSSDRNLQSSVIRKNMNNLFLNGARGLIDAGLKSARESDLYALRHLELEYNLNDFDNAYFSALITQPILQTPDLRHNIFMQGSAIINEKSVDIDDDTARHTANIGAAYRYLTRDEQYLIGTNVFLDHQWPYGHSRMSIGADAKADNLNLAANYYIPLSGFKDSRRDNNGQQYQERALEGYDIEIGFNPKFAPKLDVFAKGYHYSRTNNEDDLRGLELSAEYEINNHFSVKGAFIEENGGRDGTEITLQYHTPLYDTQKPNLAAIDMPAESMRAHIFDKVRRENRIRVEERLKTGETAGLITAQFNTSSTGLPFDVGGTATGAGINLAIDTAITIPNGDFGIINFSNGALANISASGTGNVILEFNNSTLTVTATNGGFVQFISGSGGIRTVNVPGGTVNLLGTDIDVTDNGTITTIQVRAGQIEVVPDIGAATLNGNQSDIVSLTIASGTTSRLVNPALETRQEAAYTNLDLINPAPPSIQNAAPFVNVAPVLITGPQFVGNNADIRLTFSQPVAATGSPIVNGLVGANARVFSYNAGASTSAQLVFRHTFIAGDVGATAITVQNLNLNGGTIIGTSNGLNAITAFTDTVVAINDLTPPSLISSTPADNEPAFGASSNIVLNFDENMQINIGNLTLTDLTDGSSSVIIPINDAQVSISGNAVTIDPTAMLELGTDYELTMGSNILQDTNGNAFVGIASGQLNFTTSNDITAPVFTGANIADNATQISRSSNIILNFDENIALLGTITITDADDASSSVSFTSASPEVSVSGSTITINPSTDLEYAENYEITWPTGTIEDLFGNGAATLTSGNLNFRTVNLEETLMLTLNISAPDGNVDETNVQASGTAIPTNGTYVMAVDLTIPASPEGLIFECGGSGQGQFVGFNTTDNVFRIRGGEGGNAPPDTDMAFLDVPIASFTPGDYTLTFEYNFTSRQVRAWLDETLLGSAVSSAALESNQWSGGDNCAFFATAQGSLTVGEPTTPFNGTLLSPNFRYYNNQTVP